MGAITVGVNNMIDPKTVSVTKSVRNNTDANKTDDSQTTVYQRKVFNYGNNVDSPKSTENRLGPKLTTAVNIAQQKQVTKQGKE